jgi:hypothetical protein
MNNILVHLFKKSRATEIADYYLDLYKDLIEGINLEIYIAYRNDDSCKINKEKKEKLEKF